jgi:hypothetical protein
MNASRKRKYSSSAQILAVARPRTNFKRRRFTPGRDRSSGFYGRFSGRQGELKFFDTEIYDATVANGGTIFPSWNLIPQGVTESQRVGRKCTIRRIGFRYTTGLPAVNNVSSARGGETVRVIVFLDRQANGTAATVTDILETQQYNSFNNLANSSRFRILYDKRHDMSYMNTTNASNDDVDGTSISGSFFANVNLPIEFSSTTGVIGEIRSNNIGLLLISQSEQGYLEGRVRVRFSDA